MDNPPKAKEGKMKGCFIIEEEEQEAPAKDKSSSPTITSDVYEAARNRAAYREVEHKETNEIGAAFANLDSKYHLDMNTEIVEESVSDFAVVQGMVAGKIYSPWIGELLSDIKALSISIKRKGRIEKENMVVGSKKQKGMKGWNDPPQQHQHSSGAEE